MITWELTMTQKQTKTIGLALLLLLTGLILTACGGVNLPLSPAAPPAASQPVSQTAASGEWDAASFYATTCASCHGPTGGGSAIAPALNTETIHTANANWLIETISAGRPGTAMPAWSVEFNGPLNSDQIAEMAAFLQTGDWNKAGEIAAEQPVSPMGPGMMGRGGMMGRHDGRRHEPASPHAHAWRILQNYRAAN